MAHENLIGGNLISHILFLMCILPLFLSPILIPSFSWIRHAHVEKSSISLSILLDNVALKPSVGLGLDHEKEESKIENFTGRKVDAFWYGQVHEASGCCRGRQSDLEIGERGSVSTPRGCEEECTANPDCLYFSHSKTWSDCHFCSDCEFDPSDEGIHYTSWAKLSFSYDAAESHPQDQTDYGNSPLNKVTEIPYELDHMGLDDLLACKGHCSDATCKKCFKGSTALGLSLLRNELWSKYGVKRIRSYLLKRFGPPHQNKTLVLMVADESFAEFIPTFIQSIRNLNLTLPNLVVAFTENSTLSFAQKNGFIDLVLPQFWSCPSCQADLYAKALKLHLCFLIFHLGYNVLEHDVDIFWVRDPLPYLNQIRFETNASFISMRVKEKLRKSDMGPVNGGFVYIFHHQDQKREKLIRKFLGTMSFAASTLHTLKRDQRIWSKVFHHPDFRDISENVYWLKRSQIWSSGCFHQLHFTSLDLLKTALAFHAIGHNFQNGKGNLQYFNIPFQHGRGKLEYFNMMAAEVGKVAKDFGGMINQTYVALLNHPCDDR